MKNLLSLAVVVLLIVTSCQKETIPTVDAPIPALQNVMLKNGRLHFPDETSLRATEQVLNQKEAVNLSEWTTKIDMPSMQELYLEVNEAYSQVKDEQGYREFMQQYEEVLYITPEKSISIKGYYPFLAQVLNTDGEMYVGDKLVKYTNTHKITILDGDETKLPQALMATASTDDILLEKLEFKDMNLNARNNCEPFYVGHDCYYGSHERIYGRYQLFSELSGLNAFTLKNDDFLTFSAKFQVLIKSEYKGFLGYWYLAQTTIDWSIGWGAYADQYHVNFGPVAHGTGWTAHNTSQINYTYVIVPQTAGEGARPSTLADYEYKFDYCFANLATPNISCSQDCP